MGGDGRGASIAPAPDARHWGFERREGEAGGGIASLHVAQPEVEGGSERLMASARGGAEYRGSIRERPAI